jgi:inner membrane protein
MSQTLPERAATWARQSIMLKLLILGGLMIALLIPAAMITAAIRERESLRYQAVTDITSKWGQRQLLAGPILTIPYRHHFVDAKGNHVYRTETAFFLPERLRIASQVDTEERRRGIYSAVLYHTRVTFTGEFAAPTFSQWGIANEDIFWGQATVIAGVPDMKGIRENVVLRWNEANIAMTPGVEVVQPINSGVSARVPVTPGQGNVTFSLPLVLNGSENLSFYPLGKVTEAEVTSKWPSPSFQGNFLPSERTVGPAGFQAKWKVLHFNRNFPQQWKTSEINFLGSEFGVNFFQPVDHYQKSLRSTKYAVLFILFTFVGLFFIEILSGRLLHPIQYLLMGCALTLFFSLLVSLTEQMPFNAAYACAAGAIVLVISGYARAVFKSTALTLTVCGIVAGLYAYLYILLQVQDWAFLIGNLGLLAALATVMFLSRRIDWYAPPRLN